MGQFPERNDAGAGAGERHGGLHSVFLVHLAAHARQSGFCGRGGLAAGAAGGDSAQRPGHDQLLGDLGRAGRGAGVWAFAHAVERDAVVCRADRGAAVQLFPGHKISLSNVD